MSFKRWLISLLPINAVAIHMNEKLERNILQVVGDYNEVYEDNKRLEDLIHAVLDDFVSGIYEQTTQQMLDRLNLLNSQYKVNTNAKTMPVMFNDKKANRLRDFIGDIYDDYDSELTEEVVNTLLVMDFINFAKLDVKLVNKLLNHDEGDE